MRHHRDCSLRGPSQPAGRTRLVSARLPLRVASDADSERGQFQRWSEVQLPGPGPATGSASHWKLSEAHWHTNWPTCQWATSGSMRPMLLPTRPRPGPKSGSMRDTRQLQVGLRLPPSHPARRGHQWGIVILLESTTSSSCWYGARIFEMPRQSQVAQPTEPPGRGCP